MTTMNGPRIGSLFSGYGGLDLGVMDVLGGEVVWHAETDPAACRVLAHRWPGVPNLGDVTAVDWPGVPAVDVMVGGFPCQDVSAAGQRAGMGPSTRSGLWSHMAHAIGVLRPRLVVIENVRGLLTARGAPPTPELLAAWAARDKAVRVLRLLESKLDRAHRERKTAYVHRHSRDRARFVGRHRQALAAARRADAVIVRAIGVVLGDLADLGFDARWCGLRAADVGAPHGRFRLFIVAWPAADPGGERWQGSWPAGSASRGGRHSADSDQAVGGWRLGRVCANPPAVGTDPRPAGRGTDPARDGERQEYSPRFVEWMMGLPEGWVTAVPGLSRGDMLRLLGNGVVPQQASAGLRWLLAVGEVPGAA